MTSILLLLTMWVTAQQQQQQQSKENIQSFDVGNYTYQYKKPKLVEIIKYFPSDLVSFGKYVVQKENLWQSLGALGTTAAMVPFDDNITHTASRIGSGINWDEQHSYSKVGGVLRIIPNDINSAVYYIGNGGTTMLLSGAFFAVGKITNNYRALTVSNELVEVIFSVGATTQIIKRITGRQSPVAAFEYGSDTGHWTPFPSFSAYQNETPFYDAMPSGHVATFMATLTVIAENYPEHKWIRPVGYGLTGLLAFEMVSSEVHWASDYPIAILIGYAMGKKIAQRRIKKNNKQTALIQKKKYKLDYNFAIHNDVKLIGLSVTF